MYRALLYQAHIKNALRYAGKSLYNSNLKPHSREFTTLKGMISWKNRGICMITYSREIIMSIGLLIGRPKNGMLHSKLRLL